MGLSPRGGGEGEMFPSVPRNRRRHPLVPAATWGYGGARAAAKLRREASGRARAAVKRPRRAAAGGQYRAG